MILDHDTVVTLRESHPAWRLLRANNAPLVVAFLNRAFIQNSRREIAQSELVEALEDELYALRQRLGDEQYPGTPASYLDRWSAPDHGWLRKYYVAGSDEPHYDLSPATERAVGWLSSLAVRSFVGTESRLLTLFELLRQMVEGSQTDPALRIQHLERRRAEIEAEIAQVTAGQVPVLDDTALRDRFQQFTETARHLLGDFREVEQNFRELDRGVREQIATWSESRGTLLAEIIGERDAIADSDQGRNFAAFWDYLMSGSRQDELTDLLDQVLALPAIAALDPDPRTRRLHHDWLDAGEHAQRTVAMLSKQLRRFLDDQAWLENRRIMELLHSIESTALAVRPQPPDGAVMEIELSQADVTLPMERPLAAPTAALRLTEASFDLTGDDDIDHDALFNQFVVDKAALADNVRRVLRSRSQVSLGELCRLEPVDQGLAEVVGYLELAHSTFDAVIDDDHEEIIRWEADDAGAVREARLPRVVFVGAA